MYIKFNKKFSDIDYIVGFDLALYHTGVAVYSTSDDKIVATYRIDVPKDDEENIIPNLYMKIINVMRQIKQSFQGDFLVVQEALPQQCGPFSTVNTLQALAQAHAILKLCVSQIEDFYFYDEKGVHTISVKAFFKTEDCPKPDKKDIQRAMIEYYGLKNVIVTDDISDAIAVIHLIVHKKWNQDINDEIKAIKKEIKSLKAISAIEIRKSRIEYLENLKREE